MIKDEWIFLVISQMMSFMTENKMEKIVIGSINTHFIVQ